MSNSPPKNEPSHGSPNAPASHEQGSIISRADDQYKGRRKIAALRANSTSLLSKALAAASSPNNAAQPDTSSGVIQTIIDKRKDASANPTQALREPETQTTQYGITQNPEESKNMATTVATRHFAMPAFRPEPNTGLSLAQRTIENTDQIDYRLTSFRKSGKIRGRGTSLERTQKEKRVQEQPKGSYSTNPGDTALPPLPIPLNPDALSTISNNPPTDGVRARYRSWRDAYPSLGEEKAWSIGKGSSHDNHEGKVEKSVAEALAGIEPNNRSRKASHSLRFFREGLPEEKLKKKEKTKVKSSEKTAQLKDFQRSAGTEHDAIIHEVEELSIPRGDEQSAKDTATLSTNTMYKSSVSEANDGVSPSDEIREIGESSAVPEIIEGYFDQLHHGQDEQRQISAVPAQLLSEIRKHHNLTPGAERGTSFSKSMPVTISEKLQAIKASGAEDSHEEPHEETEARPSSPIKSQDEDDESSEEQISSALFVPHQTPHDSTGHQHDYPDSPERRDRRSSDTDDPEQWLVEHEVPSGEVEQKYYSDSKAEVQREKADAKALQDAADIEIDKLKNNRQQHKSSESDIYSDIGYSTSKEEESSLTDDPDVTPTGATTKPGHYMSSNHKKRRRDLQQQTPKAPLEAIELIPYRHQVGGHTTMWRFSKRAVCKQLNNRENEFYEKVERYHPKLLKFLPRYIGVLNVTFEKQQRRKSAKKDGGAGTSLDRDAGASSQSAEKVESGSSPEKAKSAAKGDTSHSSRMISHALQTTKAPIPTVTFADNRHIIPSSFLQPTGHIRPSLSSKTLQASTEQQSGPRPPESDFTFRPTLAEKHAVSWGATTVNKQLRNEVFGEAFLRQPIPIQRHKKPASSHRSLPLRKMAKNGLRASNSESSLISAQQTQPGSATVPKTESTEESVCRKAMKAAAGRHGSPECPICNSPDASQNTATTAGEYTAQIKATETEEFEGKAGTSAPEPEVQNELSKNKKKRRYSSGGVRRKPDEANVEDRGDLKYFEEADDAGYKGDVEDDVFRMDAESPKKTAITSSTPNLDGLINPFSKIEISKPSDTDLPTSGTVGSMLPAPLNEPSYFPPPLPRPVNPKEAQTQPDSRVEYFLLLEDLTAGMKRPCIMDLKMGTRQYGVEANEKKQKSQRKKCATTTSQELGVRVCGLQVWDAQSQSYVFQDKYFGRNLEAGHEFQEALTRFLYDGLDYNSVLRHIPTILAKLQQLEAIIRNLNGYRFYAASLLLFYDGDDSLDDDADDTENSMNGKKTRIGRRKDIDFKIADFANCVTAQDVLDHPRICPPRHPGDPDRGFLRGLRSLRAYFLRIQRGVEAMVMESDAHSGGISIQEMTVLKKAKDDVGETLKREFELEENDEGEVSY